MKKYVALLLLAGLLTNAAAVGISANDQSVPISLYPTMPISSLDPSMIPADFDLSALLGSGEDLLEAPTEAPLYVKKYEGQIDGRMLVPVEGKVARAFYFGDSNMKGYGTANYNIANEAVIGAPISGSFAEISASALLLYKQQAYDYSESGATSTHVLAQLSASDISDAKYLTFNFGGNDILQPILAVLVELIGPAAALIDVSSIKSIGDILPYIQALQPTAEQLMLLNTITTQIVENYTANVNAILTTASTKAPDATMVYLTIPNATKGLEGAVPAALSSLIDTLNGILVESVAAANAASNKKGDAIGVIDVNAFDDLTYTDGIHFDDATHQTIADAVVDMQKELKFNKNKLCMFLFRALG